MWKLLNYEETFRNGKMTQLSRNGGSIKYVDKRSCVNSVAWLVGNCVSCLNCLGIDSHFRQFLPIFPLLSIYTTFFFSLLSIYAIFVILFQFMHHNVYILFFFAFYFLECNFYLFFLHHLIMLIIIPFHFLIVFFDHYNHNKK